MFVLFILIRIIKNYFSLSFKVVIFSNYENISFDILSINKVKKLYFFVKNYLFVYEKLRRLSIYVILNVL